MMNFDEKTPALWHAFNALDINNTGNCSKSTLKVLTFNVSSALCVLNPEKALDQIGESETISFQDYLNFLRSQIFSQLEDSDSINANLDLSQVDQVCWYVCSKKYLERPHKHMNADDVQKLWMVFNSLSEKDDNDLTIYPVVMDKEEVSMMIEHMQRELTRRFEQETLDSVFGTERAVKFERVLDLVEHKYSEGLDLETIHVLVEDVYEKYIVEVYKKGMMYKRSPKFNNYHDRYFVLTPKCLSYFTCREKKDCKGSVPINTNVRVMMVTSTDNKSKPHRIQLMTGSRTYELSAHDNTDKVQWLHAMENAIKSCNNPYTPQKKACLDRRRKRREKREELRKKNEEEERIKARMQKMATDLESERLLREQLQKQLSELENLRAITRNKLQEIEQQRQELEQKLEDETSQRGEYERQLGGLAEAREELERQLLEEASVSASLNRQMSEMKKMRAELERLWKEETQAREDEEKVRLAATNALREEMEKREELERLKSEMEQEQQRHLDREKAAEERQTEALRQAEERLRALEIDRKEKDAELEVKKRELEETDRAKQEMESLLAEKEKLQNSEAMGKIETLKKILQLDPNADAPDIITHRGLGAFTQEELEQKARLYRFHSAPAAPLDSKQEVNPTQEVNPIQEVKPIQEVADTGSDHVFEEDHTESLDNQEDIFDSRDGLSAKISQSDENLTTS